MNYTIFIPYLHGEEVKNYKSKKAFEAALVYYKKIYSVGFSLGEKSYKFLNSNKNCSVG
jgi:hypothetical protein